jgi:hypothetical protein
MVIDLAPHHHVKFQKTHHDFGNVFTHGEPICPILPIGVPPDLPQFE